MGLQSIISYVCILYYMSLDIELPKEGHAMVYRNPYRSYCVSRTVLRVEIRKQHISTLKVLSFY